MYHDIVTIDDKSSGFQNDSAFQYKIEASVFEEQVKALQKKDVIFTFDDGGVSSFTTVVPCLEKYGHKGVFFIATNYIGTPGFLNAEQIKKMDERGHIIGSHSCSHPLNMAILPKDIIRKEWADSIMVLESILGHRVEYASIPNGYSSPEIIEEAKQRGIHYLYTSNPTDRIKQKEGLSIIGRYVVQEKTSLSTVLRIVDSEFFRLSRKIKWSILEAAKRVLGTKYDKVKALFVQK